MKPLTDRCQGILEFKEPRCQKEVQRFIGLMNYDRVFIKNMSEKLKPFYRLCEKESKFNWRKEEKQILSEIKQLWKGKLELTIPDLNKEFI
jgi:hypothetical protein